QILGIAQGLCYLHSESIIHGDLHPGNVLIDNDGHVKLIDFGLIRLVGATATPTGPSCSGVTGYLAPELYYNGPGKPTSNKSFETDIFAFATVCYVVSALALVRIPFVQILDSCSMVNYWLELLQVAPGEDTIRMPDSLWTLVRRGWGAGSSPESEEH
ncbi:kinase-like domain-containing protein, partial [Mycena belliarum]